LSECTGKASDPGSTFAWLALRFFPINRAKARRSIASTAVYLEVSDDRLRDAVAVGRPTAAP
jgi:hypothetical protein